MKNIPVGDIKPKNNDDDVQVERIKIPKRGVNWANSKIL